MGSMNTLGICIIARQECIPISFVIMSVESKYRFKVLGFFADLIERTFEKSLPPLLYDDGHHYSMMWIVRDGTRYYMFSLTHPFPRVPLRNFVWIYDTFDNNFRIKGDFTNHFKESC